MAGKITKSFRLHNAKQFVEQFDEDSPSHIYLFIAKSSPWPNDAEPPEPMDTTSEITYDIWKDILSMKRILPSDVSFGIDRIDWVRDTVYQEYTSNSEFHNSTFYVMNEDYHVYKCIDNNNNSPSTVRPTGTLLTPITTADGYIWKYMYTISASDALKFVTNRFIPVKYLSSNDDSRQWLVQQAAANGSIDSVQINARGTGYQETIGSVTQGGTTNIRISNSASGTFDIYNGSTMFINGGTGIGQYRRIVDYDGSNRTVTVSPPFTIALDASSTYVISPSVNISGDGREAAAYSRVVGGSISNVHMLNNGKNYSFSDVSFTANTGLSASATAFVSPRGGHGSNPVDELFAHNIIMNVKMRGSEANTFMSTNDFRTVGIIADPIDRATNQIAGQIAYDQTTVLNLQNEYLTFTNDETITSTSGVTAKVVEYAGEGAVRVTENKKEFVNGETITGSVSGATAVVSSFRRPGVKPYTGDILYVEYRSPTTRSSDQEEDVKIIVRQ